MSTDARSLLAAPGAPAGGRGRSALRRIGLGALVLLGLAAAVGAVLVGALRGGGAASSVPLAPATSSPAPAAPSLVLVHVLGAVARPGLYELAEGDRVVDAVAAAGGFTAEADQAALNLAQVLADAQQVQVPRVGEAPPAPPGGAAAGTAAGGLVNLNTADLAALDTLPRVGPSTAQKILDWRESNGPFTSVDDLLAVSGIGEATLEGLRDLVTV
ncbi:ComEA family DNA-binding protein [Arenivirga flava]|nr:ComEA family DNA-binding protein [Arenivirga flava]